MFHSSALKHNHNTTTGKARECPGQQDYSLIHLQSSDNENKHRGWRHSHGGHCLPSTALGFTLTTQNLINQQTTKT